MLKALLNPFGLLLILGSLVLAVLAQFVLGGQSGQALSLGLLGLLAYGATIAVLQQTQTPRAKSRNSEHTNPDFTVSEEPWPDAEIAYDVMQDTLKKLDRPAELSQCDLISLLPETLAFFPQVRGDGTSRRLRPFVRCSLPPSKS